MRKAKKIAFIIGAITVVICVIISVTPSGHEKQFKDIIKEYDKLYSERLTDYENKNVIRCYKVDDNIGFLVCEQGYEDYILIFAELSRESVERIKVLYHDETVGYGDLVAEQWFLQRLYMPYEDRLVTVKNRKENANEVIAITGATLTSDTVVFAINECAQIMEDIINEEN